MRQRYKGEDIRSRLDKTIIRHKGVPYICSASSDGVISLHEIPSGNLVTRVQADDEDLDISSINIGYINVLDPDWKVAVYLKREPLRQFKQGLMIEHLTQKVLARKSTGGLPKHLILSKGFVDAVCGRFPTYKQACSFITKDGWTSIAISRDIAFKREDDTLKIYLKDTEVGYIRMSNLNKGYIPKSRESYYYKSLLEDIGLDIEEGRG